MLSNNISSSSHLMHDGVREGRSDGLLRQIVRRFMLQAQVPASEWSAKESVLLKFSSSLLNRYAIHWVSVSICVWRSAIKGTMEYDEGKLMDLMKKSAAKDGGLDRAVRLSQALSTFQQVYHSATDSIISS
jgi:hypothetical protein